MFNLMSNFSGSYHCWRSRFFVYLIFSIMMLNTPAIKYKHMKIGTANGVNMYHTAVYYFFNLL